MIKIKFIGPKKFDRLIELIGLFRKESEKCAKLRAYYAACILQAAALEGCLLANCDLFREEVLQYVSGLPKRQQPRGDITKWSLDQLIRISCALSWMPSRKGKRGRFKIGDYMNLTRELRNLVHPGNHIRSHSKIYLKRGHYKDTYKIVRAATGHLSNKVLNEGEISKM